MVTLSKIVEFAQYCSHMQLGLIKKSWRDNVLVDKDLKAISLKLGLNNN